MAEENMESVHDKVNFLFVGILLGVDFWLMERKTAQAFRVTKREDQRVAVTWVFLPCESCRP